jgi:HAE1 family hydrophobic/amphiphilic exporter-1
MAEGRKMIKNEEEGSLTEGFVHTIDSFPQTTESDNHA